MKNTFVLILLAMCLAACASSQTTGSAESGGVTTAEAGETTGRKKVCKRERSARVGTRVRRSCKYVDESEAPDGVN